MEGIKSTYWIVSSMLQKIVFIWRRDGGILLHQVNAVAKLHKLGYKLLLHPQYSPALVPSDYFLFPNMKKIALGGGGGRVCNNEGIAKINVYFEELEKLYFLEGIQKLENVRLSLLNLKEIALKDTIKLNFFFFIVKARYLSYNLHVRHISSSN